MLIVISAVIGALLYRLRGGWFSQITGLKQKTQLMRAIWAIPTGCLMWDMWDLPLWEGAALSVSVFCSMAFIGNGDYLDQKREQPFPDLKGALRNLIAIAPAVYFAPIPSLIYVATGTVHAKVYKASQKATGASEAAELAIGALSWATISALRYMHA